MASDLSRMIPEAYRWQRRLGANVIAERSCCLVVDRAHPHVWDVNHADAVTAESEAEIEDVFAAMEAHFAHTPWRVVHTDRFTSDRFLARLALEDFVERPAAIFMALSGVLTDRGAPVTLKPVVEDSDWDALVRLAIANHAEASSLADLGLTPEFSRSMVDVYRKKAPAYRFHLVMENHAPIAYGGFAAGPGGVGMIEDLFTVPTARLRGVARGMIAAFVDRLHAAGCRTIFLGALADDRPKRLYARLGFKPAGLARTWVREGATQGWNHTGRPYSRQEPSLER
jgi:GNAT superfamily N-acetyltransferase